MGESEDTSRVVRIVSDGRQPPVRHVRIVRDGAAVAPATRTLTNADLHLSFKRQALAELKAWRYRYQEVSEGSGQIAAVISLLEAQIAAAALHQ
jgi:hypothetical protein